MKKENKKTLQSLINDAKNALDAIIDCIDEYIKEAVSEKETEMQEDIDSLEDQLNDKSDIVKADNNVDNMNIPLLKKLVFLDYQVLDKICAEYIPNHIPVNNAAATKEVKEVVDEVKVAKNKKTGKKKVVMTDDIASTDTPVEEKVKEEVVEPKAEEVPAEVKQEPIEAPVDKPKPKFDLF